MAAKKKVSRGTALKATVKKVASRTKRVAHTTQNQATKVAINLVDFEKKAFHNAAKVVSSVQEQTEKLLLNLLQKMGWMPKEGKDVVHEWVKMMRRSRADFTRTMDKSFGLVSEYLKRLKANDAKTNGKSAPKLKAKKSVRTAAA